MNFGKHIWEHELIFQCLGLILKVSRKLIIVCWNIIHISFSYMNKLSFRKINFKEGKLILLYEFLFC